MSNQGTSKIFIVVFCPVKVTLFTTQNGLCLFSIVTHCKCGDKTCVRSGYICDALPPQCVDESDLEFCAKNMSLPCVGPKYEECPLIKECFIPDLKKGNTI